MPHPHPLVLLNSFHADKVNPIVIGESIFDQQGDLVSRSISVYLNGNISFYEFKDITLGANRCYALRNAAVSLGDKHCATNIKFNTHHSQELDHYSVHSNLPVSF